MIDLIFRNLRLDDDVTAPLVDVAVEGGVIVAIEPGIVADARVHDMNGRFAIPGFVESHIHLDKACSLIAANPTKERSRRLSAKSLRPRPASILMISDNVRSRS